MSLLQKIRHYKPSALTLTTLMYGVLCYTLIKNTSYPVSVNCSVFTECLERNTDSVDSKNLVMISEVKRTELNCFRDINNLSNTRKAKDACKKYLTIQYSINQLKQSITKQPDWSNTPYIKVDEILVLSKILINYIDFLTENVAKDAKQYFYDELYTAVWNKIASYEELKKLLIYKSKSETIAALSAIEFNLSYSTLITLNQLKSESGCCILWFDEIQAIVVPRTPYVFNGQSVDIFAEIATYNKAINPIITTNEGSITRIENGVATLITYPKYPGIHELHGSATLKYNSYTKNTPQPETSYWQTQYYVAPKGIYMHIDNANKCYAGIPFNMTIGLEEYSADKLSLRSKDAVIKKLNDNTYTITVRKGVKSFMVYMDAINADGSKSTSVAAKHIIVLQPEPEITLGAIRNGVIYKEYIVENPILNARPKNEELDITYNIKQYDISYIKANNKYIEPVTIQGNKLYNTESLQIGDRIFITDIIATDNYGNTHHVPAMSFKITL